MKISLLVLVSISICFDLYAGTGWHCPRGGKEYYDSYFNTQMLVRTKPCLDSNGKLQIAVKDQKEGYPSCDENGWGNYNEWETDWFGNEKCNSVCREAVSIVENQEAMKICNKRPNEES